MEYLKINNGIMMPVLGFGTFMLNGEACEKAALAFCKLLQCMA